MSAREDPTSRLRPGRVPELDLLKGFAIVSVVCIHAKLLEGTWVQERIINRAVPIFLVAFGISSELWWRREQDRVTLGRSLRAWYSGRGRRLLPPVWAVATLWWLAAVWSSVAAQNHATLRQVLATYLGYSPWIGISWFVTLALELTLVFPLVRGISRKLGPLVGLAAAGAITIYSVWHSLDIADLGERYLGEVPVVWFYVWIFVPCWLWHVMAGIVMAERYDARPPSFVVALAAVLVAVAWALDGAVPRLAATSLDLNLYRLVLNALVDVPLAVVLLAAMRYVAWFPRTAEVLAWAGVWSWGIYLGHMLVHEIVHMLGRHPETGGVASRLFYAILLLATGAALAALGSALRERAAALLNARRAYSYGER